MTSATRTRRAALALALGVPTALLLSAAPVHAADTATVSVLHAIPTGSGADVVDVYAGDQLLIDNFTPGTLKTLEVPAGSYDLAVFPDGESPSSGTALLSAPDTEVPAGANATVAAHLDASGNPALDVFVNDTSPTKAGEARLTVRHLAAAPAVDVRAGGTVVISGLTNPDEKTLDVPAGTVSADVVLAGTDTVVLGPADLDLAEGTSTIVYAWGSAEGGTLALASQTIDGLHSAPSGVDAGDGSSVPSVPGWAWAVAAVAGLTAVGATARLAGARSRV